MLRLSVPVAVRNVSSSLSETLTAAELERVHGFTYVSDDRLTAAVNVSDNELETFLTATGTDKRSIYISLDDTE